MVDKVFSFKLATDISREEDFTDFTLICEGVKIAAHRLILCRASPVFRAACQSGFKEATTGVFEMPEDPLPAVQAMVDFMYIGTYFVPPITDSGSSTSSNSSSSGSISNGNGNSNKNSCKSDRSTHHHLSVSTPNGSTCNGSKGNNNNNNNKTNGNGTGNKMAAPTFHANVFALAEKYQIDALRTLCVGKYTRSLERQPRRFLESVPDVYTTTPSSVKALRRAALNFARWYLPDALMSSSSSRRGTINNSESTREAFEDVSAAVPEFASDLLWYCLEKPAVGKCDGCGPAPQPLEVLQSRCTSCGKGGAWFGQQSGFGFLGETLGGRD